MSGRGRVCWVLLFCYSTTLLAAPLRPEIGMFRLGEARGEDSRRALGILEARFHRWLENQGSGLSVQRFGNVNPEVLDQEKSLATLRAELFDFERLPSAERSGRVSRLREKRQAVTDAPAGGRWVAASLAWESLSAYGRGEMAAARELWGQALSLSPGGELGDEPWAVNAPEGWTRLANRSRSQLRRDCLVTLPVGGRLESVNGFAAEPAEEISLATGNAYWVQWKDAKAQRHQAKVRCERPGQLAVAAPAQGGSSLAAVGGRYGLGRLAFIEPKGEAFHLYVFTDGVGLDEIPLEKGLSVRDVLAQPLAAELPVDRAEFVRLQQSHGWKEDALVAGPWSGPVNRQEAAAQPEAPRWYNNWTTWAVAGGIVAGILVACLATKPGQVQTQAHGGLKFPID